MTRTERRCELVGLLTWGMLPAPARAASPFPGGRRSALIEGEDKMVETAAILAARHPSFNGQGLGFDVPGTGDWPSIIMVGPGGRLTDEEALEEFFGLEPRLAKQMHDELPNEGLIAAIRQIDGMTMQFLHALH
jgi:hypothetical protein